jgi:hypothetical protein
LKRAISKEFNQKILLSKSFHLIFKRIIQLEEKVDFAYVADTGEAPK